MPLGVSNEPYLVGSDVFSRVAISAQKRYVKTKIPKHGWARTPLANILNSIKTNEGVTGDDGAINDGLHLVPELLSQNIRGEDTIIDPQDVNDSLRFETIYTHTIMPIKFKHDEWRQRGWEITPHHNLPGSFEQRVKKMGPGALQKLSDDLMRYTMDGVNQAFSQNMEKDMFRQGASYKDPVGINGQFPIVPIGNLYGHNRTTTPQMRHYVQGGTVGAGGTLVPGLRKFLRRLREATVNSGLQGEWKVLCGQGYKDAYAEEVERIGIQRNADASGVKRADMVLEDDALRIGGLDPVWWPLLDDMDTLAASELGLTPSPNAVTFSGGGSPSRQATGYAMVSAGGAVTDIVITDPGEGYTSAPTVAVATGSGATFQANIYATSSGTGLVEVEADDYRVGRLASVTVTGGGTGFTAGDVIPFTDRSYFLFIPALKYSIGNGIDRRITVPADPARQRYTEVQMETLHWFYNRMPAAFGLNYIQR